VTGGVRPPGSGAARAANRALAGEAWARDQLAVHAGQSVAVVSGPLEAAFRIGADGTFAPAPRDADVALRLKVSPLALPAVAADPSRFRQDVRAEGDAALAATLEAIAQTAPWFVERAFAAVFGPIAGQALADAGRTLLAIPAALSGHAAASLGQFAGEADLVAQRHDVDAFSREVAALDARVESLAARVAALAGGVERSRRPKVT
jgi:ubiquinone biosynthesis protein UbiJ